MLLLETSKHTSALVSKKLELGYLAYNSTVIEVVLLQSLVGVTCVLCLYKAQIFMYKLNSLCSVFQVLCITYLLFQI